MMVWMLRATCSHFRGRAARLVVVVLIAIATSVTVSDPLSAQVENPRFKSMGTITVEVNGEKIEMIVPWDSERDEGYAQTRERVGRPFYSIAGGVLNASGALGATQFSVGFMVTRGQAIISDVRLTLGGQEARHFGLALGDSTAFFAEFELIDDERVIGNLSAKLVQVEGSGLRSKPIPGADPLNIVAKLDVALVKPD